MSEYGYVRGSARDQCTKRQVDELEGDSPGLRMYSDVASGADGSRPGLSKLMETVQTGDTIIVVSLDRLGRTLADLVSRIDTLHENGIGFRSLRESIDTTSSTGRSILHVFAALARFERERALERTRAGLAAARAAGRLGGRPRKTNEEIIAKANRLIETGLSKEEVAGALRVSRSTIYRILKTDVGSAE